MSRPAGSSKLLRSMNESAALAYLLDRGRLTRGDLRELTGLSKPTTSDVLRRLTDAGLAIVAGHTNGGPGPNAEVYTANPAAGYAVALSLRTATPTPRPALVGAVCDLTGQVLARYQSAPEPIGPGGPVALVSAALASLCQRCGVPADRVTHVHLGVPGSYDPGTDTIHHIDVAGWSTPGLVGSLAERLGATVHVDNDVNLAAIAERGQGVARGSAGFTLLWFGTGLGLAIDLGGSLLRGARGRSGEIGYMPLRAPYEGTGTPAGDGVELHDLVGGAAVRALAERYGLPADTPEAAVHEAVSAPDQVGTPFLRALAGRIAVALAAVAAVLDPPLVVLAGEVAQAGGQRLRDAVAAAFTASTPFDTPIEVTSISGDAVLLGALDAGLQTVRDRLIDSRSPGGVLG